MKVELQGLEVFGHHGVLESEQREGQTFLFDVELEVGERGTSDRLEDAVDYGAVCERVASLAETRSYALLERLADAVCADLLSAFPLRSARVRVRKPHAPLGRTVEWVAVTVERDAGD